MRREEHDRHKRNVASIQCMTERLLPSKSVPVRSLKVRLQCFSLHLLYLLFCPRLHPVTYCYTNRFLPALRVDRAMGGGEKMIPTWAQRREELLSDCLVSPDIFHQMLDRLGEFVVPYQQALASEAAHHPMHLYLQGLLSHLP